MKRIPLEKALEIVLDAVHPIDAAVELPLLQALGLRAAVAIYAPLDNPPFDRSPLDGFTLRSGDTCSASAEHPAKLLIQGESMAGTPAAIHTSCGVSPGTAVRIMTGAMIPSGCDCVVPREAVREDGGKVLVFAPLKKHENYSFRGGDIQRGQLLIPPGEKLGYAHMGILAGMGIATVKVIRPPQTGLLCTGDELTPPGQPLLPGKIYNSNETLLSSRLSELGFSVRFLSWGADDPEKIAGEIAGRIDDVDILITTGGVSVGDRDFIPVVFEKLPAELLFRGMDFKPGSAVLCGMYRGKLLMCLSGNPFASLATFELLVKPVLARLAGRDDLATRRFQAVLKNDFPKASKDRRFIRARLEDSGAGGMDGGASGMDSGVYLPDGHSSEQLFSLVGCNCLADIPQGSPPLKAGSMVEIVLL